MFYLLTTRKSALIYHFEEKQEDRMSRASFLRRFRNAASQERLFRYVFGMLQFKSDRSETSARTHKTENFPIPRVVMVRMSRKEATFYSMSTKEYIVDVLPVDNEEII